LMARTVNQTLLFTTLSPHEIAGSEPAAVAPDVVDVVVLLAHNGTALEQLLFCEYAADANEMQKKSVTILIINGTKIKNI